MRLHSEVRSHGEGHAPASRVRLGEPHLLGAAALFRQLESLPGGMCIGLRPRMQQRENRARACGFERDGERSDFGWRDDIVPSGKITYRPRGRTPRRKNALLVGFAGAAESAGSGERRKVKAGKSVVTARSSDRRCSAQAVDRREDGWRVQRLAAAVKLCSGAEGQGRLTKRVLAFAESSGHSEGLKVDSQHCREQRRRGWAQPIRPYGCS